MVAIAPGRVRRNANVVQCKQLFVALLGQAIIGIMASETLSDSSAAPGLDLGKLPELLGFHLRIAHVAMYRDFANALSELELTQKQCATLQLISANPAVSQVDLAATLGTDRASMMAMIDRLEQRGLVSRRRSVADRRRQELNLSAEGRVVLTRAMRAISKHEDHFTSRFTKAELEVLFNALSRIHQQA
jgi:DNA-binding MarR family transcriptional regulator